MFRSASRAIRSVTKLDGYAGLSSFIESCTGSSTASCQRRASNYRSFSSGGKAPSPGEGAFQRGESKMGADMSKMEGSNSVKERMGLPEKDRFGATFPEEWNAIREEKMRKPKWMSGAEMLINLAMLYCAGSIGYDLFLKVAGKKPMGSTPYETPPDWMVRSDQRHIIEEARRREVDEALAERAKTSGARST